MWRGGVREDFRNFFLALLTGRLNKDWQNTKDQFHDLRARLEQETDYVAEAAVHEQVRSLFREDDCIVVPRVYPEYSTARILTMDRLDGVHIDKFMARSVAGGAKSTSAAVSTCSSRWSASRYNRTPPSTPAFARMNFGVRSMLYRLKAKIDYRTITEEEVRATGWDRSDYA